MTIYKSVVCMMQHNKVPKANHSTLACHYVFTVAQVIFYCFLKSNCFKLDFWGGLVISDSLNYHMQKLSLYQKFAYVYFDTFH